MIEIRKGQAPAPLAREEFSVRFRTSFIDPAFRAEDQSIARLEEIAWQAYTEGRKAPFTRKAGPGYADPDYQLSVEWIATKLRIDEAQLRWADPSIPSRVLLICGSARNDGTCPGEMSKTFRLLGIARETLERADILTDVLDLSLLTSDYGRRIHPCKGCVSTAMPRLCTKASGRSCFPCRTMFWCTRRTITTTGTFPRSPRKRGAIPGLGRNGPWTSSGTSWRI